MEEKKVELYNEAYCYYYGEEGYPLNYEKALELFEESANLSYGPAMNYLGCMYEEGTGCELNLATAFAWFEKGAALNDSLCFYNLGRFYLEGIYVVQNEQKASEYYRRSFEIDQNPRSAYMLGCDYFAEGDLKTAEKLFRHAATEGDITEAWHNLGWVTMRGATGKVCESEEAAFEAAMYYKKAAERGFVQSMDEYGRVLIKLGRGNVSYEAKAWIKKAADAGYEPAIKRLKALNFGRFFGL